MGTAAVGSQAKLAFEPDSTDSPTFDTSSEPFEFLSESLALAETFNYNDGIRGTRSRHGERVALTQQTVSGSLAMQPTPVELDLLLPRILGAAESTDTFALAETLPTFAVLVDRVTRRFQYTKCRVSKATFSASEGQPLSLSLEIEGKAETVSTTAFPALSIDAGGIYVFSQGVLTLASTAYEIKSFELVIDNALATDRYMNALTRDQLPATDRIVTLNTTHPFSTDEVALYQTGAAGVAGSMVFTNGGVSTTFTLPNLKYPAQSPTVQGKGEIMLNLGGTAYKLGSTNELEVTHDSAP